MSKRLFSIIAGVALVCLTTIFSDALETRTEKEHFRGQETVVELTPTGIMPGAKGTAKFTRGGDGSKIQLDVSGFSGEVTSYTLYAVDDSSKATSLGTLNIQEGSGSVSVETSLQKFSLVISPESDLTAISESTRIILKSAAQGGGDGSPSTDPGDESTKAGDESPADLASTPASSYDIQMLGVPALKAKPTTPLRVDFAVKTEAGRANAFLKPGKEGETQITLRFFKLKPGPTGSHYALWAALPGNNYQLLGLVTGSAKRKQARIDAKSSLQDFGLFLTIETVEAPPSPTGAVLAKFTR